MSILSLLSREPQRLLGPSPEEGGLLIDAVITESFKKESDVTMFPIELGAEISDHIIPKPAEYVMKGIISDHPMQWRFTKYASLDSSIRHLSAFSILLELMTSRQVFDIKNTGYLDLDDVVITGITSQKTAQTTNELNFEATLRVLNIVSTSIVPVTPGMVAVNTPAEGQTPEAAGGAAPTAPPTSSLASDILGALGI
jgi:hypothetical protein